MSRKPVSFEPSRWTGLDRPGWPDPADHPWPASLTARASLVKHFVAPSLSLAVVALAIAGTLASMPEEPHVLFALLATLVVAGLFCALGYWRARQLVRRNDALVELGAGGLSLPGLFGKTVPWSEVSEVEYVPLLLAGPGEGIPSLRVRIRGVERFGPKSHMPAGVGTEGVAAGFVPLPELLDVSSRRLHRAIEAHRAHFGRAGRALPGATTADAA